VLSQLAGDFVAFAGELFDADMTGAEEIGPATRAEPMPRKGSVSFLRRLRCPAHRHLTGNGDAVMASNATALLTGGAS